MVSFPHENDKTDTIHRRRTAKDSTTRPKSEHGTKSSITGKDCSKEDGRTETGSDSRAIRHVACNGRSMVRKISERRNRGVTEGRSAFR